MMFGDSWLVQLFCRRTYNFIKSNREPLSTTSARREYYTATNIVHTTQDVHRSISIIFLQIVKSVAYHAVSSNDILAAVLIVST